MNFNQKEPLKPYTKQIIKRDIELYLPCFLNKKLSDMF
jgi:hypothetical protein